MQGQKATSFADDLAGIATPSQAQSEFDRDLAMLPRHESNPAQKVRMVDFKDGQRPDTGTVTPGELALRVLPIALGVGGKAAGAALSAPRVIGTKEIASSLLDEFGRPIVSKTTEYGPSVLSRLYPVAAHAAGRALKYGGMGAGGAALYKMFGG